jgi:hypothetical protein
VGTVTTPIVTTPIVTTRDDARARTWRLLVACARRAAGIGDVGEVAAAAEAIDDWDEVRRRAEAHGLLPWLARALFEGGIADGARAPIAAAASVVAARTLRQTRRLGELVSALGDTGVRAMPYKGPALSLQLYGDLALRQSVDLDLVVPRAAYPRARDVLSRHGLPPRTGHSWRQERALFAWLGHAPFGRGDDFVELHWRFADRRFPFALDADRALDRARPTIVAGRTLPLMAPDDLLVTLAMHGTRHLYERLEWLAGVTHLLASTSGEAARLAEHAASLRARRMLAVSVHLAGRVLAWPIGDAWRHELARDPESAAIAARMAAELEAHELEDQPWLAGAALLRRYADLLDAPMDRARLLVCAALAPTARDHEAVALPDALLPLHRVLRPLRLAGSYVARALSTS